jgi:hypothetical protein
VPRGTQGTLRAWGGPPGSDWQISLEGARAAMAADPPHIRDDHRLSPLRRDGDRRSPSFVVEVQNLVRQAVPGGPEWPPADVLPMPPDEGTIALVSSPLGLPLHLPLLLSSSSRDTSLPHARSCTMMHA